MRKDKDENFNRSVCCTGNPLCSLTFEVQNLENPYLCHKKYRVHQGLSGLFDLVWLQYSFTARKYHTQSKKAHFTPLVHNILFYIEN